MANFGKAADSYAGLRDRALRTSPKDLNLKLTSFSSGDASLYFSSGGGVLGGVGIQDHDLGTGKVEFSEGRHST